MILLDCRPNNANKPVPATSLLHRRCGNLQNTITHYFTSFMKFSAIQNVGLHINSNNNSAPNSSAQKIFQVLPYFLRRRAL